MFMAAVIEELLLKRVSDRMGRYVCKCACQFICTNE